MGLIITIVAGYLLGSLQFAYLAGRLLKGIDLREVGTRNAGSHNTMLEVGRGVGFLVAALDFSKGAAPVLIARALGLSPWAELLGAISAILGHRFPLYVGLAGHGFKGGTGLGASLGALLAMMPGETLVSLCLFGILYFLVLKSMASVAALSLLPLSLAASVRGYPAAYVTAPIVFLLIQAIMVLPKHIDQWKAAEDKRDLILNRWLRNPNERL